MTRNMTHQWVLYSSAAIALGLTLAPLSAGATPTSKMHSGSILQNRGTVQISQSFKPPNRGTPPPTAGGATRGNSCVPNNKKPISLIPKDRLGLTFSANPTFYWHIPSSPAKVAKFLILTGDDVDVVYEATIPLPVQSGIISYAIPKNVLPLEIGKRYHWFLTLDCNPSDPGVNPITEGWTERIAPDVALLKQLEKADLKTRASLYADNGIWHEAVTTLASLRRTNPQDLGAVDGWNELLKSVGLSAIAAEPLFDTTISQNPVKK
ncbi:MAG: hypothetical protein DCF22_07860 [Leptolyngbya sp.]|nr:MAG: hypothetical protein DCF22_07860 [Leptolyngbya sp.]